MTMTPMPAHVSLPDCVCGLRTCLCPEDERVLRAYAYSDRHCLPAMSAELRAWCSREIVSVEGWTAEGHDTMSDRNLARDVLEAWMDFCRDKGLL